FQLPRSTRPDGHLDGQWGQETSSAVAEFQRANGIPAGGFEAGRKTMLALDVRLRAAPPKPEPQPVHKPAEDNQELEETINQVSIAYQLLVTGEGDGVVALCRDLANLDQTQPSPALGLLVSMLLALIPPLYGFVGTAFRTAIEKELRMALEGSEEI